MSRFVSTIGFSVGGVQHGQNASFLCGSTINRGDGQTVPAALVATLQTRTDNDTGVLRFTTNPLIIVGDRLDVYWNGGMRYGMKASSISGAGPYDVTVGTAAGDIGAGDNFPIAATPLTVGKPITHDLRFDGDDALAIVASAAAKAAVVLCSGTDTAEWVAVIKAANQVKAWYNGNGDANPVVGDVLTVVFMSHGDSTADREVKISVGIT